MTNLQLKKKHLLAILAGFITVLLIGIINSTIFYLVTSNIVSTFSSQDFRSAYSQQPYLAFGWILRILSYLSPVVGGVVVGWIVREKGWIYGGILGVTLKLISIGIVSLAFILPSSVIYGHNFPASQEQELAQKNILNQLLYAPITIALASVGGYLGEHFHKRNRKKR